MKVSEIIQENLIAVPLPAATKTEAISKLVDLLGDVGLTSDREGLLNSILAREAQRTTGIGRGFALPHAKTDAVERLTLAFGRTSSPVDFAAIDGKPVSLIALLVSPPSATGPHLLALAAVSRLVINQDAFAEMLQAGSPAEFAAVVRRHEEVK
ncbi:MAG TPA: PTS sugar transporter subunit IIA [Phycisphaerae bacterium]|nr:PTS sugar transporter subunit IIA [Phycisphaerae bacterium]